MVVSKTLAQDHFNDILEHIDNAGPFQKKFSIVFIFLLTFTMGMQCIHKILSLAVPDHWCYVPGRETTNYSVEEWKDITIPRTVNLGSNEEYSPSKCLRYSNLNHYQNETETCDYGWEYDHTWYDLTAPMKYNWVCDDEWIPTTVLAINRIAEMIGTLILGQVADNYGRKPVFYFCLIGILIGRIGTLFSASWDYLFYFSFLGSFPCSSIMHSAMIIAIEISDPKNRAHLLLLYGFGWAMGVTISPLLMWWQRNWIFYGLITTLPAAIYLFTNRWFIESPRWLVSNGKQKTCVQVLNKIAKANNTKVPKNIDEHFIEDDSRNSLKTYTILSIFTKARLAKNVLILIYGVSVASFIYVCLLLSAMNLYGNPYLNYMFLGLIDFPMFFMTKYFSDRFGRRWVALASLLLVTVGSLTMTLLVHDVAETVLMTIFCIGTKGTAAMAIGVLNMQVYEICPTCIRQSGTSLVTTVTNVFCILCPYAVSLGAASISVPYCLYAGLALSSLLCCIFLPETLGHRLPDTLSDAAKFGADQDIWGKAKPEKEAVSEAKVPLQKDVP